MREEMLTLLRRRADGDEDEASLVVVVVRPHTILRSRQTSLGHQHWAYTSLGPPPALGLYQHWVHTSLGPTPAWVYISTGSIYTSTGPIHTSTGSIYTSNIPALGLSVPGELVVRGPRAHRTSPRTVATPTRELCAAPGQLPPTLTLTLALALPLILILALALGQLPQASCPQP